jgi:putative phage-type endonuclease
MRVLNNIHQGTTEWHAERSIRRCASEAPAMMGLSKYISRSELLRIKSGGAPEDVSSAKQAIFDRGHEAEAAARVIAEQILGEDLYPCTAVSDDDLYLASVDGMTDDGSIVWEHKLYSAALAEMLEDGCLSPEYLAQVDHQMMVTGAQKCLFMASDGTTDFCRWIWVERDENRIAALVAGWDQFALDLANYTHPSADPVVIGVSPESLPALRIEVTGMVTASNLREFKAHAVAVFDGINTDLQTDADFANAEKAIKFCADIESRIDAAKQHALSQTASIDELFRTLDEIKNDLARNKRLTLEKLVKVRKDAIRVEIMNEGVKALAEHYAKLASRIGVAKFPGAPIDFAGAIKGKRTIESLRDAVSTALAHAKIAANELADRMGENLKTLRGSEDASLFPDAETLATKAPEDVLAIMQGRIAQAKAEADRRAEEARERIRREEQAKAEADRRAQEDLASIAEPPRGGAIQPQVAAEPDAADWRAELVDIRELCRAIADGEVHADLVQFNQAAGNRLATAIKDAGSVPGVRFVRDKSMAVRV